MKTLQGRIDLRGMAVGIQQNARSTSADLAPNLGTRQTDERRCGTWTWDTGDHVDRLKLNWSRDQKSTADQRWSGPLRLHTQLPARRGAVTSPVALAAADMSKTKRSTLVMATSATKLSRGRPSITARPLSARTTALRALMSRPFSPPRASAEGPTGACSEYGLEQFPRRSRSALPSNLPLFGPGAIM